MEDLRFRKIENFKPPYTEEDMLREDAENNAYKSINAYVRHNPNQYHKPPDENKCCCDTCCKDCCKNCDSGSCLVGLLCGMCLFK